MRWAPRVEVITIEAIDAAAGVIPATQTPPDPEIVP